MTKSHKYNTNAFCKRLNVYVKRVAFTGVKRSSAAAGRFLTWRLSIHTIYKEGEGGLSCFISGPRVRGTTVRIGSPPRDPADIAPSRTGTVADDVPPRLGLMGLP